MKRRGSEAREPTAANAKIVDRNMKWSRLLCIAGLRLKSPTTWSGQEQLPRSGGVLIVSNHVSLTDPFTTVLAANRTIHYLATQSALSQPILGRVLRAYGAVPKRKFTTDVQAIRKLKRWRDLGRMIGIFPEGQRSWDGRLLEFIPGIDALVRMMKVPVITVRIYNADRQWPRWAESMRRGRVHFEFDAPVEFSRQDSGVDIHRHLRERLTIDLNQCPRWPVRGKNLALGVENPVFACPRCYMIDGLRPHKDEIECQGCGSRWRMDTLNLMHGLGGAPSFSVIESIDRVREYFSQRWVAHDTRYGAEGVILESAATTLLDTSPGNESVSLGTGYLQLRSDTLRLLAPSSRATLWSIPLTELTSVSVEMRRRLQFGTEKQRIEAVMPAESVVKWEWFLEHWRLEAQPEQRAKIDEYRARYRAPA